jgi:hypothetical protein
LELTHITKHQSNSIKMTTKNKQEGLFDADDFSKMKTDLVTAVNTPKDLFNKVCYMFAFAYLLMCFFPFNVSMAGIVSVASSLMIYFLQNDTRKRKAGRNNTATANR